MNDISNQITEAIQAHKKNIEKLETKGTQSIAAAAQMLIDCFKKGGRVYICGNGGSAADAQHIAAELIGRFEQERKGLPAVALTTDASVMTSLANDYGFENIFARQVEALARSGDILWAISTSGSSANILTAARLAKEKGVSILSFTGKADSELERISDVCFCIECTTAQAQQIHQLAYHIICRIVENNLAN